MSLCATLTFGWQIIRGLLKIDLDIDPVNKREEFLNPIIFNYQTFPRALYNGHGTTLEISGMFLE